jgi:hypothetical protein
MIPGTKLFCQGIFFLIPEDSALLAHLSLLLSDLFPKSIIREDFSSS